MIQARGRLRRGRFLLGSGSENGRLGGTPLKIEPHGKNGAIAPPKPASLLTLGCLFSLSSTSFSVISTTVVSSPPRPCSGPWSGGQLRRGWQVGVVNGLGRVNTVSAITPHSTTSQSLFFPRGSSFGSLRGSLCTHALLRSEPSSRSDANSERFTRAGRWNPGRSTAPCVQPARLQLPLI
jgi:hypothetical protein